MYGEMYRFGLFADLRFRLRLPLCDLCLDPRLDLRLDALDR